MNGRRIHWGTFLWGMVLTLAGVGLLGADLGWWELRVADLRFIGPLLLILIGAVILIGSLTRRET